MGGFTNGLSSGVSEDVFAVTPSDTMTGVSDGAARIPLIRALYVTGAGTVKYRKMDGSDRTITVPANFLIECAMTNVWSTGTSATGLLGYV